MAIYAPDSLILNGSWNVQNQAEDVPNSQCSLLACSQCWTWKCVALFEPLGFRQIALSKQEQLEHFLMYINVQKNKTENQKLH